jgi:hypothetical protein
MEKHGVLGEQDMCVVTNHCDNPYKYSEADIKGMLDFLVYNIYVGFVDQLFYQSVGIPVGTDCAPLVTE